MKKLSGLIFIVLLLTVSILAQTTSSNSTSKHFDDRDEGKEKSIQSDERSNCAGSENAERKREIYGRGRRKIQ